MKCFKNIHVCKDNLCGLECCSSLICRPPEDDEFLHEFTQQSNFYRKNIALLCKASTCTNRAPLFSEILTDSPIYNAECLKFHQTTLLDMECKKSVVKYCTQHGGENNFVDSEPCNNFITTNEVATFHDFTSECDAALAALNTYPLVSKICYEFIVDSCQTSNNCVCFWGEKTNTPNQVQIVPCIFNTCIVHPRGGYVNVTTCVLFILTWMFCLYFNKKLL